MRKLAVVALAVFLAGCSARGIITSEKQVVVQSWTHSMAVTFAQGECRRYGRDAVLVGSSWETYVFDCREAGMVEAVQVPQIPDPVTRKPPPPPPVAPAPVATKPPVQTVNRAPPPPQSAQRAAPPAPPAPLAPKPPPPPPPAAKAAPPPASAPPRQAVRPAAPPKPGWWVQVAADRTRTEAEVTGRQVIKKFAKLLSQRKYRIVKVTVPDIGVYYRSRFGPYPSKAAAVKACYTMKQRRQSCIIAR